ncbi:hypothetical protein C2E23DRAFT_863604 [Lenzites betulinus]|nr:hypothetical protein C2E23DRAFT_863604 [Lenzites betulinus]
MAGPTTRKNKPQDDPQSPSPSKRIRRDSPSEKSSSTTSTTDDHNTANHLLANPTTPNAGTEDDVDPASTNDIPDYVPDEVRPRIERLQTFSEPKFNRYSIGTIPDGSDWGHGPNGRWSHLEALLCYNDKPLVVWMVGVVRWVNLESSEKFTIGVRLLSQHDIDAATRNSLGRCVPEQQPKDEATLTYANKWVDKKARGSTQIFSEAYSAVDNELRGWDPEQKVPATTISPSDIVVVEFYIRRFKGKTGNTGRGWTTWGVNFDLLRIAQIFVGPGPIQEPPPESSAFI